MRDPTSWPTGSRYRRAILSNESMYRIWRDNKLFAAIRNYSEADLELRLLYMDINTNIGATLKKSLCFSLGRPLHRDDAQTRTLHLPPRQPRIFCSSSFFIVPCFPRFSHSRLCHQRPKLSPLASGRLRSDPRTYPRTFGWKSPWTPERS